MTWRPASATAPVWKAVHWCHLVGPEPPPIPKRQSSLHQGPTPLTWTVGLFLVLFNVLHIYKIRQLSSYQSTNPKTWILLRQSALHCVYYIKLQPCTSKHESEQGATIQVNEFHQTCQATIYTSPHKIFLSLLISRPTHCKMQNLELNTVEWKYFSTKDNSYDDTSWSGNRSMRRSRFIGIILT